MFVVTMLQTSIRRASSSMYSMAHNMHSRPHNHSDARRCDVALMNSVCQLSSRSPHCTWCTAAANGDAAPTKPSSWRRSLRRLVGAMCCECRVYTLILINFSLAVVPLLCYLLYTIDVQNAKWAANDRSDGGIHGMSTAYNDIGFYPMGGILTLLASNVFDIVAVVLVLGWDQCQH